MNRILTLLTLTLTLTLAFALACTATPSGVSEISQEKLLAEPDSTLILDVRTADEFASGHVPRAVNIPHDQLAARVGEVEAFRNASVVLYCERGGRAGKAANVLTEAGFSKLHHLTGDMTAWRQEKRPTETTDTRSR